ncbi:SDR family NAD(P)-dependent oxidoreductase [Veronia nyctiphanis]|nr:SDR family oxidoreductase [Veronia nyctiphanis]
MNDFSNKTIVITGAASGMGRAYALEFAKLGANLALNDYDDQSLRETEAMVKDVADIKIMTSAFDVSNFEEMQKFGDQVKEILGPAFVVINNAGIEGTGDTATKTDVEAFRHVMDVNFYGVYNGSKVFLSHLEEKNEGILVNVSSIFGLVGIPRNVDYCASKFAVAGLTQSLMAEYHHSPISIHCVHPGGIDTNISRRQDANSEKFKKAFLRTPPEKIARHVINKISKKKPQIVFGYFSLPVWLAAKFCPLTLWNMIINRQL